MGGATAGYRSDCSALDGNRNIMSCWDDGSHYSSAFAKLRWKFIFITQVRETLVLKIGDMCLVAFTICLMLLFKNNTNAFSSLFFACIVGLSGLASGGSRPKLQADFEERKVKALTGSSQHHT